MAAGVRPRHSQARSGNRPTSSKRLPRTRPEQRSDLNLFPSPRAVYRPDALPLTKILISLAARPQGLWSRIALYVIFGSICTHPQDLLDNWVRLYEILIARNGIAGPQRFSRSIFARQSSY
jgi:hypothetical protein